MNLKSILNGKLIVTPIFVLLSLSFSALVHAEEVTQKFNGLTLNANLELADGKDFNDGMVLIVHGYLTHNKMELIRTAQEALLDNDRSSLAINLSLGIDNRHGFYDCTLPQRHLQDDALKEIAVWVEWLRSRGVSQIVIMAHSRGANQVMVYAVEQKDPEVTHLLMLAPGSGENIKNLYQARYGKSLDQTLAIAQRKIEAGKGTELIQDIDLLSCPKAQATAETFISYYSTNKFRQFNSFLPRISIPTLIIVGTLDEYRGDLVNQVKPYIDGNRVQLKVIQNADHFFRDFNMEEAIEASIEFIHQ